MIVHTVGWSAILWHGFDVDSFIFIWLCNLRRNGTYLSYTNKLILTDV